MSPSRRTNGQLSRVRIVNQGFRRAPGGRARRLKTSSPARRRQRAPVHAGRCRDRKFRPQVSLAQWADRAAGVISGMLPFILASAPQSCPRSTLQRFRILLALLRPNVSVGRPRHAQTGIPALDLWWLKSRPVAWPERRRATPTHTPSWPRNTALEWSNENGTKPFHLAYAELFARSTPALSDALPAFTRSVMAAAVAEVGQRLGFHTDAIDPRIRRIEH